MQKSKKNLLIFLSIILLLIIISIVLIAKGNKTDRLIRLYKKILDSNIYTFSLEENNQENNYKMVVSQKGDNINIDTVSGKEHTSTLILNGHIFVIMHNLEEYYSVDGDSVDGDVIISGLKEMANEKYVKGREEIDGKSYYYEEYKNKSNFLQLIHETDDSEITTRFYFDNNDLAYIRNIVDDEGEKEEELLKIKVKYEVDESVFSVPKEYAEM